MSTLQGLPEGVDPAALAEASKRRLARLRFLDFVTYCNSDYVVEPLHKYLATKLQDFVERVERRESPRLIVKVPPQHGKSLLSSRNLPAWFLGRNPKLKLALMSYSADWATSLSRDARNILTSEEFARVFPNVQLAPDAQAADEWSLTTKSGGGGMKAVGRDGGITGRPAHILVVDDPIKNRDEAYSETVLKNVKEGFGPNFRTRVQMGGGILIVATQWSHAELIAHLIDLGKKDPNADQYEVVNLMAIAEDDDPLGRQPGEPLAPKLHDLDDLNAIRASLDSPLDWEALYCGRPTPETGAIFSLADMIFEPVPRAKPEDWEFLSIDTAFSEKQSADYSVIGRWRVEKTCYRLLHVRRERLAFPALKRAVNEEADTPGVIAVLIEDKASGQSLIQELRAETRLPVIPWKPDRDKVTRAHAVTPLYRARKIRYPDYASTPWLKDYVSELLQFPAASHDDQVDMTTQGLTWAREQQPTLAPTKQTTHPFTFDEDEKDPEMTSLLDDISGKAELQRQAAALRGAAA